MQFFLLSCTIVPASSVRFPLSATAISSQSPSPWNFLFRSAAGQQFRTLQAQVRGRAMSTAEVRLVEEDVLDDREEFEESWSSQEDEVDLIEEWIDNGSEGKTRRPSLNVDSILWSL